jgi:hypothetical protein
MIKGKDKIRAEIDETLDRLLANDLILGDVRSQEGFADEVEALEKLQESLMAHLMHLDSLLSGARDEKKPLLSKTIAKRLSRSEYVRPALPKPRVRRRRVKDLVPRT